MSFLDAILAILNIESWGKDCARKKSGQHASMTAVFAIPEMLWICFWDAPNFYEMLWIFFEMLWTFCWDALIFVWDSLNGHNDFIIRAAASAPLPPPIYASFEALGAKKLRFAWGTPLRCITSDQFIRGTEIKLRFCPFHCMHFDALGGRSPQICTVIMLGHFKFDFFQAWLPSTFD